MDQVVSEVPRTTPAHPAQPRLPARRPRLLAMLVVAVGSLLAVPAAATAKPGASASGDAAYVEAMLFTVPLGEFITNTTSRHSRRFDWTTDWCSAPLVGSTGRSFDFHAACRRHDFGYRNLPLLERRWGKGSTYWNHAARLRVDRQFLADMRAHCATRSVFLRPTCRAWARTFYVAVRSFGGP